MKLCLENIYSGVSAIRGVLSGDVAVTQGLTDMDFLDEELVRVRL